MDMIFLCIVNFFVGNKEIEVGLEIMLMGFGFFFEFLELVVIVVMGVDFVFYINGELVFLWKLVFVKENSVVLFGLCKMGSCVYFVVVGGFDVFVVMESKSMYVRVGIGGFYGRVL